MGGNFDTFDLDNQNLTCLHKSVTAFTGERLSEFILIFEQLLSIIIMLYGS